MASSVETVIRSVVTKGIMAVSEFNRTRQDKAREHPFLTGIHAPMTSMLPNGERTAITKLNNRLLWTV